MSKCEFCQREFSSHTNLMTHMKTAKYCLKLRGSVAVSTYDCEFCGKNFTQKAKKETHSMNCNSEVLQKARDLEKYKKMYKKVKKENALMAEMIKKYEQKTINLEKELEFEKGKVVGMKVSKPPIINNNTIINQKLKAVPTSSIQPFNMQTIEAGVEYYSYEHFLNFRKGLVNHLLNITIFEDEYGVVNKNYVCTNRSQNTFHILVSDEKWTQDNGAFYIHKYLDSLKNKFEEHVIYFDKQHDRVLKSDDTIDVTIYKNLATKLLYFKEEMRGDHENVKRQNLLASVRSGIKDRLAI